MVAHLFARGAPAAWASGLGAPIAKLRRRTAEAGLPGLTGRSLVPPGAVAIRLPGGSPPASGPALGPSLARLGSLEVRLAVGRSEIRRAQRLRYEVFYGEMSAVPSALAKLSRRDVDAYDAVCDHLLVVDHAAEAGPRRAPRPKVVGTYRLLRGEVADAHLGFYTAGEYDIGPVLAANAGRRLLELGRSCVLAPYRGKRTVELLWTGIYAYVLHHRVDALIGCASLEGTDPDRLALPLSFLHHRARALPGRHVPMDRLAPEAVDPRAALHALPPLIKGYLRLGATFGDGAVIDRQFGTTDVFVVLPVEVIAARYRARFAPAAERRAA